MTNRSRNFESSVMRSLVMPSLKYCWLESPVRFSNGKTAMEGLSGKGNPAFLVEVTSSCNRRGRGRGLQPFRHTTRAIAPAALALVQGGKPLCRPPEHAKVFPKQGGDHVQIGHSEPTDAGVSACPIVVAGNFHSSWCLRPIAPGVWLADDTIRALSPHGSRNRCLDRLTKLEPRDNRDPRPMPRPRERGCRSARIWACAWTTPSARRPVRSRAISARKIRGVRRELSSGK